MSVPIIATQTCLINVVKMSSHDNISVDGQRLWQSLMDMATIGALPGGGCCRLALTDDDKQGRDLFVSWCEEAGCNISVDEMGNIFACRSGIDNSLPPVVTGSHLDTQPHGGKFDGVYGVLAGLEVIRALNDADIETNSPIEVVVWTNEEGSRFSPAMLASGVYAGLFELEYAQGRQDADGKTVADELNRIGYAGSKPCRGREFDSIFEAHIEQGPILERNDNVIGVVTGGQGQRWYDITVTGQDSHSGSTPMLGRKDALVGSSAMTLMAEKIAHDNPPQAVITVGSLAVHPNSRNTIPGRVGFTIDMRHPDDETLTTMGKSLRTEFKQIANNKELEIEIDEIWHNPPVVFDTECVNAVRDSAEMLDYRHQDIVSGAGHDACQTARVVPTAMVFIPCEGGLSHNEAENATLQDLEAGCNVLMHAMLKRAIRE